MDSNRSAARPFSGRQLEFSNPFMSGEDKKKKREKKEREEREREDKTYKDSFRVPFRWELTAGKPKLPTTHTSSHTSHSQYSRASTRHVGAGVEEGGRDVPALGLNRSPRRVSSLLRSSGGTVRSEEQPPPACSMADGDDDGSFSEMATQAFLVSAVDEQHPRLSPGRLTDPAARGFIMERFLPAAQAMASDADSTVFQTPPTEMVPPRLSPLSLLPPSVASSIQTSAHLAASSTNGVHSADHIDSANSISSVNFTKCSANGFSPANGIRFDKGIGSGNGIGPDNSTDYVGDISFNKGVGSDKHNISSIRGLSSADFSNSIDGIGSDNRISSDMRIGSILGISSANFSSSGGGFEDVGVVVPLRLCGFLPPCVERFLCISNRGVRSEKTKKKKKTKEMKTKGSHLYRPRSGRLIDMIGEEDDDDDWSASEDEDLVARQVRAAMRQRRVLMSHTSSPGSSSVYYDALSQPQTPLFSPFRRVAPQSPFREGKVFLGLPKTAPTCFQTPRASVDVKPPNPVLETNNPQPLPLNLALKTNSPPPSLPFNPPLNSLPETSNPPQSIPPDPPSNPPLKTNSAWSFLRNPPLKTNNPQSLLSNPLLNPLPKTKNPCSLPPNPPPNPPLKINSLQSLPPNSPLKTDSPQSLPPNPLLNLNPPPKTNDPPQSLPPNPLQSPRPKTDSPQSLLPKTSSLQSLLLNPPPKTSSPRKSLPPNPPPETNSPQPLLLSPAPETNSPGPLPPLCPVPKTDSPRSPAPEEASDASNNSSGKDAVASPSVSRGASRLSSGDDEASITATYTNEKCESWPLGVASTTSSSDSPSKSPGRHRQRLVGDKDSPVSVLSPPLPKSPSDSWLWKAIPSIGSYPSPLSAPKMKR